MRFSRIAGVCLLQGFLLGSVDILFAQGKGNYWQQEISYKMDVTMDVEADQFTAIQSIRYSNNSPDVLDKLYFHLYLNAFQPGSEMDIRSRLVPDPDPRIGRRISRLSPRDQGFQKVLSVKQGSMELRYQVIGTILEVIPKKPVQPGQTIRLHMEYLAQVPVQIRRNGRDNEEGIRYSMSQWYPKMCEYDRQGWHTPQYIGREFYGVWGDFEVNISIDSTYTVAATGYLRNASEMGHGYGGRGQQKSKNTTWSFTAKRVHDFVWAADPDYVHDTYVCKSGLVLHLFYQEDEFYAPNWKKLPPLIDEAYEYIRVHFGEYPYSQYAIIQGGDAGMEYPMATLITSHRTFGSLLGTTLHEFMHNWYYGVLGFNESYFYWMDEGFSNFTENVVTNHLRSTGLLPGPTERFPFENEFADYAIKHHEGIEEPMSTHADHFDFNSAYIFAAYTKGAIFLYQLEYIIGKQAFDKGMLDFYNAWKFKHPDANDFIRVMEITSGLELDWYLDYMVNTVKTIEYTVDSVFPYEGGTAITLYNPGKMPMPVDVDVKLKSGETISYTIPLDLMRGGKIEPDTRGRVKLELPSWRWVDLLYAFSIPYLPDQVEKVILDPQWRMADMDRSNNQWPKQEKGE